MKLSPLILFVLILASCSNSENQTCLNDDEIIGVYTGEAVFGVTQFKITLNDDHTYTSVVFSPSQGANFPEETNTTNGVWNSDCYTYEVKEYGEVTGHSTDDYIILTWEEKCWEYDSPMKKSAALKLTSGVLRYDDDFELELKRLERLEDTGCYPPKMSENHPTGHMITTLYMDDTSNSLGIWLILFILVWNIFHFQIMGLIARIFYPSVLLEESESLKDDYLQYSQFLSFYQRVLINRIAAPFVLYLLILFLSAFLF